MYIKTLVTVTAVPVHIVDTEAKITCEILFESSLIILYNVD